MSILGQAKIIDLIQNQGLIKNPLRNATGDLQVQPASYDLRAGRAVWKDSDSDQLKMEIFKENDDEPPVVTLRPGQMVIVVGHEELNLPKAICGTVYSRNRLQKDNILALNAGHVDPGFQGQIIIRLINLGSTIWTLRLGDPIFTIVFQTLDGQYEEKDIRTPVETLGAARRTAEQAFSNPFHDLYKSEIATQLIEHDNKLENKLREKLAAEFFRKNQVQYLVIEVAVALFAALVLVLKVPWAEILKWLR
jgi:deoxycytidine triphosphate deaminase